MLVELANETIAAAQQVDGCFSFADRIGESRSPNDTVRAGSASVSMSGFNRSSVNNKTEQQ